MALNVKMFGVRIFIFFTLIKKLLNVCGGGDIIFLVLSCLFCFGWRQQENSVTDSLTELTSAETLAVRRPGGLMAKFPPMCFLLVYRLNSLNIRPSSSHQKMHRKLIYVQRTTHLHGCCNRVRSDTCLSSVK